MKAKGKSKKEKVNKQRGDTFAMPSNPECPLTVSMKKAMNGFVVNVYGGKAGKDRTFIAKDKAEAQGIAAREMGKEK